MNRPHLSRSPGFLWLLGLIAVCGLAAGCVLALSGYSSAGPFSVAAACVGVLGTLASQNGARGQ